MATISAPDLVKLRTQQQHSIGYLSVLQPVALLVATVNGVHTRGARSIAYNNGTGSGFSTIEAGQTLVLSSSIGLQRIRVKGISGNQVNGTISVDENGIVWGSGGDTITIYHNYEVHPIPPAIRSQVFYKFYDLVYNTQNSQPNPVAIAGPHKVGWLTTNTITRQISVDSDDGFVSIGYFPTGTVYFGFRLGIDHNSWFRFQNVTIPNAAVISSAALTLVSQIAQSTTVVTTISGDDEDNANAPVSLVDYNGRPITTATVAWNFSTAWAGGESVTTPDLTTIIQEIVNRAGWASGNALQLFIKNNAGVGVRQVTNLSAILNVTYVTACTFALDASDSYAVAQGATISSYAWSCVHNGGGTSGISFSNAAIANPTLTITQAGQYWLKLTVTDSNGKTQSTYRALWVYDRNGTQPYVDFTIQSLAGDWTSGGWKCSLQATGELGLDDLPDYALVVISYDNFFNGVEDYVNLFSEGNNVILAGYLRQDSDSDSFVEGTGNATFQITTIDDLLNNICELGTVSLNAVTNPTKWYEYASWMAAGRSIHHLIRWHSWGVLETCDILGLTDNVLGVKNTDYAESSLLQQVNTFSYQRGIFAKLISNRLGQMYLVADSQMLNTAGRAALDTIFTILAADISGVVDVVRSPEETVTFGQIDGFAFNGSTSTPYVSILPGYRASSISYIIPNDRGGSTISVSNQILASQTDSNEKIGRYLALQNNNPRELRFSTPGNYLGAFDIIPSLGWYAWGIIDASLKRNIELFGKLFVCRNVSHTLDFQAGVIQTSVVLEKEAIGPDGIQGNYPTSYPSVALPDPNWTSPSLYGTFLIAFTDAADGNMYGGYLGSITLGTLATFIASFTPNSVEIVGLSTTQAVVAFTGTSGRAIIANMSGNEVLSFGALATFSAGATSRVSLSKLTSSSFLLNCLAGVGAATISGDTITFGALSSIGMPVGNNHSQTSRLGNTKGIVIYDQGGGAAMVACIVDVSGTTITPGTPAAASSNNATLGGGCAISATEAIVVYTDDPGQDLRATLLNSISGTTFAISDDIAVDTDLSNPMFSTPPGHQFVAALDSTRVVVVYQRTSAVNLVDEIVAVVITSDGTNLTAGSIETVKSQALVNYKYPCVTVLNSGRCLVGYQYGDPLTTVCRSISISGTTITVNDDETTVDASGAGEDGSSKISVGTLS